MRELDLLAILITMALSSGRIKATRYVKHLKILMVFFPFFHSIILKSLITLNTCMLPAEGKQDPKSIKCYHEKAGGKFQQCWKDDGFETCFTKFDPSRNQTMFITILYSFFLLETF